MRRNHKILAPSTNQDNYNCSNCGILLFEGTVKFDIGSGFPSFWRHIEDHVRLNPLATYGRERIQLLCKNCGQHLGHLFRDKRTPTELRYCVNSNSINKTDH